MDAMDYDAYDALLHHIFKQVSVFVTFRVSSELFPYLRLTDTRGCLVQTIL